MRYKSVYFDEFDFQLYMQCVWGVLNGFRAGILIFCNAKIMHFENAQSGIVLEITRFEMESAANDERWVEFLEFLV